MDETKKEDPDNVYGKLSEGFGLTTAQAYRLFKSRSFRVDEAVDTYAADLNRLYTQSGMTGISDDNRALIEQFLAGLPEDIARELSMSDKTDTVTDCVKYVQQTPSAEKIGQRPQDWNPGISAAAAESNPRPHNSASRTNFNAGAHGRGDYNGGGSGSVLCYICRRVGHFSRD